MYDVFRLVKGVEHNKEKEINRMQQKKEEGMYLLERLGGRSQGAPWQEGKEYDTVALVKTGFRFRIVHAE